MQIFPCSPLFFWYLFSAVEACLFIVPSSFWHESSPPCISRGSSCDLEEMLVFYAGRCFLLFLSVTKTMFLGPKGMGAPMTRAFFLLPCLPRVFFKYTQRHTRQINILGIPMFSVMWLGFRGNLLTSVPGAVVTWVACLARLPAADQLCDLEEVTWGLWFRIHEMRGLGEAVLRVYSTRTKNSLVLCSHWSFCGDQVSFYNW